MPSLRSVGLWLALFATACLLAGCGAATHASVGHTTAAPTPHHPAKITKAQASAFVHAVNLRAADLPNMQVTGAEHREARLQQIDHAFARCLGSTKPLDYLARIHSPKFTSETEGEFEYEWIGSLVEVRRTATSAEAGDAHLLEPRGLSCVRHLVATAFKPRGEIGYAPVDVTRLPTALPGVAGSFGFRFKTAIISLRYIARPVHFPIYIDLFGFVAGAAEISLVAVGAPEPVPTEADQRLAALLYSRANASPL
jgi:hypothetical protein